MRRQVRSAIRPVGRSLPRVLLDGMLVALAYLLAFRLRFGSGVPAAYQHLLQSTVVWVVVASLALLSVFGTYRRRSLFARRQAYGAVFKAMAVATLASATVIAVAHQVRTVRVNGAHGFAVTAIALPPSVIVLFLTVALVLLDGVRFLTSRTVRVWI